MGRYTVLMPDDVAIKSLSSTQLRSLAADAEIATSTLLDDTIRTALLTVRALFDGRQFHISRDQLLELHEILYGVEDLSAIRTDYVAYECALYFWADTTAPEAIATAYPQSTSDPSLTVVFTDASTGTITRWNWDYGDGATEDFNGGITSHFYAIPGIYFAVLTVSNSTGEQSQLSFTITVGVGLLNLVTEDGTPITTEDNTQIVSDT